MNTTTPRSPNALQGFRLYDTIRIGGNTRLNDRPPPLNGMGCGEAQCYRFEPDDRTYLLYQKPLVASTLYKGDIIIFLGYQRIRLVSVPWVRIESVPTMNVVVILFDGRLYWKYCANFNGMYAQSIGRMEEE